jgi:hypothetical protein
VLEVFEIDGRIYRVLQQRYAKDTLHIVYINDQTGKQIKNSLRDWVSTLTQKPTSSKNTTLLDGLEKNYMPNKIEFSLNAKPIVIRIYRDFISSDFLPPIIDTLTPPPEA